MFTVLANRDIFEETKEYLPIILVSSSENSSAIGKTVAVPLIKSLQLDSEDLDMSAFIYQMIFGNFTMFFHQGEEAMVEFVPH